MTLVVCVDDNGGMMFGGRRQSQDRVLRAKLLELCAGHTLRMSPYSAKQFDAGEFQVCDNPCDGANETDVCFVEDTPFDLEKCRAVWLFRWNRRYPADVTFPTDLSVHGFTLLDTQEFVGSSHPNITLDRYQRGSV